MTHHQQTEDELFAALQDRDLSVMALVGHWGTGKTHLWRNAAARLARASPVSPASPATQSGADAADRPAARDRDPCVLSLFGVRRLADLKLQILQDAWLGRARDARIDGPDHRSGAAVLASNPELASITLPMHLLDRLVVIDDVERKHAELGIEELMGFIDTSRERWGARFLLLLNTDRLDDQQQAWRTLYEKVIDRQIVLKPTPADALAVAFTDRPHPFAQAIAPAVERLGLTNIRVIRRIADVMSRLSPITDDADPALIERIVPSVVLMSAIHFRALRDAPPLDYVAAFDHLASFMARGRKSPQELAWDELILRAGIRHPGAFERILQRLLETGHLDRDAIARFLGARQQESAVSRVIDDAHRFLLTARWDIARRPADMIAQAQTFIAVADRLPAYLVGALAQAAGENGGLEVERSLIDACLAHFDALVERGEATAAFFETVEGPLHPRLRDRAIRFDKESLPERTLTQAILRILGDDGWGDAERKVLTRASPEQFTAAMNAATPAELMQLVTGLLRWMKGLTATPETDAAHRTFLAASRRIVADAPYSLLARLLIREFTAHGLQQQLRPGA